MLLSFSRSLSFKHLQTSHPAAENAGNEVPSSAPRFRLDMLKNKAKRSLTESFESILSRVSIFLHVYCLYT